MWRGLLIDLHGPRRPRHRRHPRRRARHHRGLPRGRRHRRDLLALRGRRRPGDLHVACDVRDPGGGRRRWSTRSPASTAGSTCWSTTPAGAPYALAADASPRFHAKVIELNLLGPAAAVAVRERRHAAPGRRRRDRQRLQRLGAAPVARHRGVRRGEGRPRQPDPQPGRRVGAAGAGELAWTSGMVLTEQSDLHYGGDDGRRRGRGDGPAGPAGRRRATSATSRCSWPRRWPATSPGRPSRSTAAARHRPSWPPPDEEPR